MSYTVDQPNSWAIIRGMRIRDPEGRVVAQMAPGTTPALAHLFAAAPELLEAAETGRDALRRQCDNCLRDAVRQSRCPRPCRIAQAIECLEAAIAKAKGGTNP